MFALLTLGFPATLSHYGLSQSSIDKLVGSFFNRHAVEDIKPSSTLCRHMVSELFHSPHRGAFHLSLTVLVHYRSLKIFSLTG